MDDTPTRIAIFKACATTLLNMDLSPEAASAAASSFRNGQMGSRLAVLLDGMSASETPPVPEALITPPPTASRIDVSSRAKPKPVQDTSASAIFDDIKRKKISKSRLFALLEQTNESIFSVLGEEVSMREALVQFQTTAPPEDWAFLVDIIKGSSGADPYLVQLSGSR